MLIGDIAECLLAGLFLHKKTDPAEYAEPVSHQADGECFICLNSVGDIPSQARNCLTK